MSHLRTRPEAIPETIFALLRLGIVIPAQHPANMTSNGNDAVIEHDDSAVQEAFSALAKLEQDFAMVELDARKLTSLGCVMAQNR